MSLGVGVYKVGGAEKTKAQTGTQTASYYNNTLWSTASKQLRISHEVPLLEASGHPYYSQIKK